MSSHHPAELGAADEWQALIDGNHSQPHRLLGVHEYGDGLIVRTYHPEATEATVMVGDDAMPMERDGRGGFWRVFPCASFPLRHQVSYAFQDGASFQHYPPYQFPPTIGDMDQHLFNEGRHRQLWNAMGAHLTEVDGVEGVAFAVWAPSARRVSVVGEFCRWDGRFYPMRSMGSSGIFELFIPGIGEGELYKFELKTGEGHIQVKTDPLARYMEHPPHTASRVYRSRHRWNDQDWMDARERRDVLREPLAIYEMHAGSWRRDPSDPQRLLSYREIAHDLIQHVRDYGFNAIELMPITEYPFDGSWGYQVSGYFAPTSRFGTPDDLRWFVDQCHQAGIAVIIDWVPAHFPKDAFALANFDGSFLYEHPDPRRGEHPDWGTLIFNYGRPEVRGFLIASALYWLNEFHLDGLRVDAVASMLYLDYSREDGAWEPNPYGGRENLEAVAFLRELNDCVHHDAPGCFTVAEESTAWPGVTTPTHVGGLGFDLKWNMGWMHDTLLYMGKEPIHRRFHHDQLTFAMVYEQSERFLMPLSHDEVVHGKGSIYSRMPGDRWQRLANLRLLYAYQYTRPGKILNFMGFEIPQEREWDYQSSLDWHLGEAEDAARFGSFLRRLGRLYQKEPALWRSDYEREGYEWIDGSDRDNSVIGFIRRDERRYALVALNFTPVPRLGYRLGCPTGGRHRVILNSDDLEFGGSGVGTTRIVDPEAVPFHGRPFSVVVDLPPLGALVLAPEEQT